MADRIVHRPEAEVPWERDPDDAHREARVETRTLISAGRTPTSQISMGTFRMPPGAINDLHHHEPPEIYYVTRGEAEVFLDGDWRPLRTGDVVFVPSDATHGTRNLGDRECVIVWAFPVDSYDDLDYEMDRRPLSRRVG